MDVYPNVNYAIPESVLSDCHNIAYKQEKNIALINEWMITDEINQY